MRALHGTLAGKRSSVRSLLRFAFASGVFVVFLGFVELMRALGVFPISIAAPSEIYATFVAHADDLWFHLKPTLWATVVGYFFACTTAMALAMLAVLVKRSEGIVYNFAVVIYSIPLIASAPILVMWFGVGSTVRIIIAAIAGFFPVLVGAIQGLRAVDRQAAELFHCLSASKLQEFRLLALPSALPYLFAGLKISAASALLGAIISEWVGAEKGLGLMMAYALFSFNVALVWLTLIVSIVSAILAYSLVGLVEKWVVHWERPAEMIAD
ncbi:MAG: ABC transporter permease [Rhodospirillaceae bacterium]|nr:ABC transporter permease [Rhodospirillaceae bacterium]MDE0254765.1 ABC transporter permease [Rhodospirillaceae bacterium]MDE0617624.1 ABC transporter permease [Rhodospirillaceae bacterium]